MCWNVHFVLICKLLKQVCHIEFEICRLILDLSIFSVYALGARYHI